MAENKIYSAVTGLNLNSVSSQRKEGQLTYALNATVKGFDGKSIVYQNEVGNTQYFDIPSGYSLIGRYSLVERSSVILFLAGQISQVGILSLVDGSYKPIITWSCLNFNVNYPIHKVKHKVTSLGTEIYWTDNYNTMRYLNIDNPPSAENCNLLALLPKYAPVFIDYIGVENEGELVSGTYQIGFQYASATSEPFSEVIAVTNPISVFNPYVVSQNLNEPTGKSIKFQVQGIDTSGVYEYYNIIVAKTINNITSFELVGTYRISDNKEEITYTGQSKSDIRLTANEFFEQFARYEKAGDVTSSQDILIWSDLTSTERINYQEIFSRLELKWVSYKMPHSKGETYAKPIHTANLRGYFRDEVYAFEGQFILDDGSFTDGFHIPGRPIKTTDLEIISNTDGAEYAEGDCSPSGGGLPRWKVYNTATSEGLSQEYVQNMNDSCYLGPYETGEFGYYQSTKTYPDTDLWGELRGLPIRHHRFPDSTISHHHDNEGNIYPLGVTFSMDSLKALISSSSLTEQQKNRIVGVRILRGNRANNKSIIAKGLFYNVGVYERDSKSFFYPNYPYNDVGSDPLLADYQTQDDSGTGGFPEGPTDNIILDSLDGVIDGKYTNPKGDTNHNGFATDESKKRYTFHSPDTHFYQPFLGNQIKIDSIEYGTATQHVTQVKGHARYQLIRGTAYATALAAAALVGAASGSYGMGSNQPFNGEAAFTAFAAVMEIVRRTIPRVNYAYQINGVGDFNKYEVVPNEGNKLRFADIMSYLISGMTSVGDTHSINNYNRESSVYVRITSTLPFTHEVAGPEDTSKYRPGTNRGYVNHDIACYYGSLRRNIADQYGNIYSYETIDTGASFSINDSGKKYVFGGDCFINRFGLKRKLPYFTDNRVSFPDESDIDYRDVPNIARPKFWFSTDFTDSSGGIGFGMKALLGIKLNNFDPREDRAYYQYGKFYLFNYGINYFFAESEVNVDYRQAYNNKEGDFFPHVGNDIPDEWLQEINVPIAQDNTYFYNKSFSKQNKEKVHSHIPIDFDVLRDAVRKLPNTAFYSDPQFDSVNYRRNNWRIYRPVSKFDFPLGYGKLTSLEGIDNGAVLARFENKSLVYNSLIRIDTSSPQAAYIGNDKLFRGAPPVDFIETDTGFGGSQHKFFLKTEQGKVSVDARRNQIILFAGSNMKDLASEEFNCSDFFRENLPFQITKYFPEINIDNHYQGLGLHGVYDNTSDRFIITKLDYIPLDPNIQYQNGKFMLGTKEVYLTDTNMFCSRSFTMSFSFLTQSWVSFHTYLPTSYIGTENVFFSSNGDKIYKHSFGKFNYFYDSVHPYTIEYPLNNQSYKDDILQSVSDGAETYTYVGTTRIQDNQRYFNRAWIYNDEKSSGELELIKKDRNNLSQSISYPKFLEDKTQILYTKADNLHNFNSFWNLVKIPSLPFTENSCNRSDGKSPVKSNHKYGVNTYGKEALRGKNFRVRLTLDNASDLYITSRFLITEQQVSHNA